MLVSYESHKVYAKDELPWPPRSQGGKYMEFYRDLEEDQGKWHVWTISNGTSAEQIRSAILTYARTQNWKVETSRNGSRLAARRIR